MHRTVSRPTTVTAPATEPVTLAEAKKQLELASDSTHHDEQLVMMIQEAREQWEHDTDSAIMTQTLSVTAPSFYDGMELPRRPIQSISSITYFDTSNTQQTLSTDVYELDAAGRRVRRKYDQTWPSTVGRWDAVTITYLAGYTTRLLVPGIAKRAMLLLIGRNFTDRDMTLNTAVMKTEAYDRLVMRYMRSSYP